MRILLIPMLCIVTMVSCQNRDLFYIQHTKLTTEQLPHDCSKELIKEINTSWLKHGQSDCHYYNVLSQSFVMENMDCVVGMEKKTIIQLLGKPDSSTTKELIYQLDKECGKEVVNLRNRIFRADIVFMIADNSIITNVVLRSKQGY